jgi:hypothetical protein
MRGSLVIAVIVLAGCSAGLSSTDAGGPRDGFPESSYEAPPIACHCPTGGGALSVPADVVALARSATGDTCTVMYEVGSTTVFADAMRSTTCHIQLTLEDGAILSGTVELGVLTSGCCAGLIIEVGSSPFPDSDGGVDASDASGPEGTSEAGVGDGPQVSDAEVGRDTTESVPTGKDHGCTPGGDECGPQMTCTVAHGCCHGFGSDCSVNGIYPGSGVVDRHGPCTNDDMCLAGEYCQAATKCCPVGFACDLSVDAGGADSTEADTSIGS